MVTATGATPVRGSARGEIPPSKETITSPCCSTSARATAGGAERDEQRYRNQAGRGAT